jgi:subtilisin family serine protease
MRKNATKPRLFLALTLGGLVLAASGLGASSPAAAFGGLGFGFGRGGGFGGPSRGPVAGPKAMAPTRGGGRVVDRPPGLNRGGPGVGGGGPGPAGSPGVTTGGSASLGGGGGGGGSGVPPSGERRFVPNEIITVFSPSTTPQAIDQIARRYNLTQLESQRFALTGSTVYRWRLGGSRSVADTVGAIEDERGVAAAQPNYVFALQEDAAPKSAETPGDSAQYVLAKLQIEQAHQLATGKNILVAVIDSEIDVKHPDLDAAIVKNFDAVGAAETPHRHGTAMAGAIAAHKKLMGIAPSVQLLAARAFDEAAGTAEGTSFAIYKSLQWAADNNARVVNMSFAGPADPMLHRMLAAAYEKGMVLIAAAGNAGPNSPPLYPAADPSVIAVTATDRNDGVFALANRGSYIAVAAPGVEILAIAPADAYQITSGTSVATAHVSGVAALLLERQPSLKPAEIRAILMTTAKPLGSGGQRSDFGAGLANAYRAVTSPHLGAPAKARGEQAKQ